MDALTALLGSVSALSGDNAIGMEIQIGVNNAIERNISNRISRLLNVTLVHSPFLAIICIADQNDKPYLYGLTQGKTFYAWVPNIVSFEGTLSGNRIAGGYDAGTGGTVTNYQFPVIAFYYK